MSIKKLIVASVATMSVFRKFAALSDDEKNEVVKKVKEKMNVKDEGDTSEDSGEETTPEDTETTDNTQDTETEDVKDTTDDKEPTTEDDTEDVDSEEDGEEDTLEDDGDVQEGDDEEVEVNPEPETEEPAEETEEEPEEPEGTDLEQPIEEDKKDEMAEIVDGLVKEVETIKQDGQVSQGEVIGLIKTMMEMVSLLVEAKAPTRRKRKSATREFEIAMRVANGVSR